MENVKYFFKRLVFIFLGVYIILFNSCNHSLKKEEGKIANDFNVIKERGKIIAVTQYNSTDYFIYKGEPMGYQLELLQLLSDYLNMQLEVIVRNDLDENFRCLEEGGCDLLAINLTVNKPRNKKVNFTLPIGQTRQVLVQRKPENSGDLIDSGGNNSLIRNQLELAGKKIYVQKHSAYVHRLHNLSEEIGEDIDIIELEGYEDEELIKMVAEGEIEYTVCDEHVAMVSQKYYSNIDIETPVSFPQNLAWAVNKNSIQLLDTINDWISMFKGSKRHAIIYDKYFKNDRSIKIVNSEFYANLSGKVSPYDDIIKEMSIGINWDWRLLAAMIYQESRFKPNVKSWAGAFGLMQLMPSTARTFGVNRLSPPKDQIYAGAKFIEWLDEQLQKDISDKEERIKFILGSYNAGLGHVSDARRLALKYGKDPNNWEEVASCLMNKSNPKYYNDPEVKYGYCRGEETYNYVSEILFRYNLYKNIITEF